MVKLELIELADLTKPRDIAKEIIKQNPDISLPIPIEDIAEKSGISEIRFEPLESIEGALVANDTKSEGIIVVNNNARHHRQRFTLGHELGHFLLPRHGYRMQCTSSDLTAKDGKGITSNMKVEFEANEFSAELIMPEVVFKSQPEFRDEPTIENILKLSEKFYVSFEACARRYIELNDYQVAMVFSENKVIRYGWRGNEIPFWLNVKKGNPVPFNSATQGESLSETNSITLHEVDPAIWFNSNKNWELPSLLVEEVYIQENNFSATLLWIEEEIAELE